MQSAKLTLAKASPLKERLRDSGGEVDKILVDIATYHIYITFALKAKKEVTLCKAYMPIHKCQKAVMCA